ncbi:MAG: hypothetical protein P8M78_06690 [Myxococcota bacterium]|nr:hypothetical protein [Myxococcota bacterium]
MPHVSETIPDALQPQVESALAWFNASAEAAEESFQVTGILDAEQTLNGSGELQLILCGGDRCEQRSFKVSPTGQSWAVEFTDSARKSLDAKPQAELDPPPGPRRRWLEDKLSQHAFVVLLFYRGFW